MRNWAITFFLLAALSGLVCLGADSPAELGPLRVLMVVFGVLGAYAAATCWLQSRARTGLRPARDDDRGPLGA